MILIDDLSLFCKELIAASDRSLKYADCHVSISEKVTEYENTFAKLFKTILNEVSLPSKVKVSKAHVVLNLGEAPGKRNLMAG